MYWISKYQIPNIKEIPMTKILKFETAFWLGKFWLLVIEIWDLFVIWYLKFVFYTQNSNLAQRTRFSKTKYNIWRIFNMPIYEYVCKKCDNEFEYLLFGSSDDAVCPKCEKICTGTICSIRPGPDVIHWGTYYRINIERVECNTSCKRIIRASNETKQFTR